MSQAEKPNQVDVLLKLYQLRLFVLDVTVPLKPCVDRDRVFGLEELPPMMATTRHLLSEALQVNFFSWYIDRQRMRDCSYVSEMQLFFHSRFKSPEVALLKFVQVCGGQVGLSRQTVARKFEMVHGTIMRKLIVIMLTWLPVAAPAPAADAAVYSEKLVDLLSSEPPAEHVR